MNGDRYRTPSPQQHALNRHLARHYHLRNPVTANSVMNRNVFTERLFTHEIDNSVSETTIGNSSLNEQEIEKDWVKHFMDIEEMTEDSFTYMEILKGAIFVSLAGHLLIISRNAT